MTERVEVEHLIVGAGVVGLAIGAELARGGREAFVLEAGSRVGCGISSRNSEVIHSGIYYEQNSLKHRLCIEGRRRLYAYCEEHKVAYRKCGKLIVATSDEETPQILALSHRAEANGVEGVVVLEGAEAMRLEPSLNATLALHVRESGIIDVHEFMLSLVGEIEEAGGAVLLEHRVVGGRQIGAGRFEIEVKTAKGSLIVSSRTLVLAAGPWNQAVAATIDSVAREHAPPLFLAKGSYFSYPGVQRFSRLIYPVPVQGGLGVHLTLDLAGAMRFGPDVEWLTSNDPDMVDFAVDPKRAQSFYASIRRYWPELADGSLQPGYAGVRPKLCGPGAHNADFLLQGPDAHGVAGLVALYGIESPGLTSSLAIGARVSAMLEV
ncbi:MAG: NAD(P)/FAD-dependent oxidoreductase [Alphaproteobacteria bacterium]|nr:NAD(P)/FAD-dependent oxidoreductase [Alphaproteobacteria bacterium]MBM3641318.1 NAD(P)/FAD-dependent oxidoreductase [Alphaproteobacteria bacterium]